MVSVSKLVLNCNWSSRAAVSINNHTFLLESMSSRPRKRCKTERRSEAALRDEFHCHANQCLHNFFVRHNTHLQVDCHSDPDLHFDRYVDLIGNHFTCCPHDPEVQRVMHQHFVSGLPRLAVEIASFFKHDVESTDPSALFSPDVLHVCIEADTDNNKLSIISAKVPRVDTTQWENICALVLKKSE